MGNSQSAAKKGLNPKKLLSLKSFSNNNNNFFSKKKNNKGLQYPVPPDAERPSPPSRPEVFQEQNEYFVISWDPPAYDGGCPLMGYIIQHLELGIPGQADEFDDMECWYSSEPGQVTQTECLLHKLIPGTTYQFRVLAENLLGYSEPSEVSAPIVFNPYGELDDWFAPPYFTMSLDESYTVYQHERVEFVVEARGQPYPLTRWVNERGEELQKSASYGPRRTLVITNVKLGDAGLIKCVADNGHGVVECSTRLIVQAPPLINCVERKELNYQSGEIVKVKFTFSGNPTPTFTIHKDEDLVTIGKRVSLEIAEPNLTFKIINVEKEDSGFYTISLENDLGEDSQTFKIHVTDKPEPPTRPEILQLSDNTCILQWRPVNEQDHVDKFIVEYFRMDWGVWLTAVTTRGCTAKIRDLIPGSKYKFRIKAENSHGVGEPGEESVEIHITDSNYRKSLDGDGLLMKTVIEEEEHEENDTTKPKITTEEFMSKLQNISASSSMEELAEISYSSQPEKIHHRKSYDDRTMEPFNDLNNFLNKETSGSEALLDLYATVQKPKKHVTLERPQSATFGKDSEFMKPKTELETSSSYEEPKPKSTLSPIRDFRPRSRSRSPMPNFEPKPEDEKLLKDLTFEPKSKETDIPEEEKRPPTPASEIVLRSPSLDKLTDYISMKVAHKNARVADSLRAFSLGKMYHSSGRLVPKDEQNEATDDDDDDDPFNFKNKKKSHSKRVTLSTPNMSTGPRVILCDEEKPPPVVITDCSLTVLNNSQVQLWRSDIALANDRIFDEENMVIKEKPVAVNIDDDPPPGLLPNTNPPQKIKEIYQDIVGKNIGRVRKPRHVPNPGTNVVGSVSLGGGNQLQIEENGNKNGEENLNTAVVPATIDLTTTVQPSGSGLNYRTVVKTGLFILLSPLLFLNIYVTIIVFTMYAIQMYHFRD